MLELETNIKLSFNTHSSFGCSPPYRYPLDARSSYLLWTLLRVDPCICQQHILNGKKEESRITVQTLYYVSYRILRPVYVRCVFLPAQYILNSCLKQENPYCLRLLFHFNTHCLTFSTIHKNRRHARGVLCIFVLFLFVFPIVLVMPVK